MDSGSEHVNGPGVGALLRASRLRCGEDLQDIAHLLRIRYTYLDAIEDGRFKDLPGLTYALGFVRAYAEHLGLDSAEVVRRFKVESSDVHRGSELLFPTPIPEGGIPGGAILFVGVFVAAIAYGGWYVSTSEDGFLQDLIEPIPERLAALISSDEVEPAPPATADVAEVEQTAPTVIMSRDETPSDPSPTSAKAATTPHVDAASEPTAPEVVLPIARAPSVTPPPVPVIDAVPSTPVGTSEPGADIPAPVVQIETPSVQTVTTEPAEPIAEPQSEPTPALVVAAVPRKPEIPTEPPVAEPVAVVAAAVTPAADIVSVPLLPPEAPVSAPVQGPEQVVAMTPAAEPQPAPVPAPRTAALNTEGSRILLRAIADSWVQIRDGVADKLVITRLLKMGDSYQVPDQPGLVLVTGNAGALEIVVDGAAVGPIGPMGAVRRNVALDADKLRDGTAVPN